MSGRSGESTEFFFFNLTFLSAIKIMCVRVHELALLLLSLLKKEKKKVIHCTK
jgi:hypothetical protein